LLRRDDYNACSLVARLESWRQHDLFYNAAGGIWQTLYCRQLSCLVPLLAALTPGHRFRFQTPERIDEIAWTGVDAGLNEEPCCGFSGQNQPVKIVESNGGAIFSN
jgi:hypothetical protein